jgi:hypothetical protein
MSVTRLRTELRRRAAHPSPTECAQSKETPSEQSVPARRTGGRPRKQPKDDLEPPVTRGYVAKVLDVDVSTVRRLETRGQLHPTIGARGIRYFEIRAVLALKERRRRAARSRTVDVRIAAFEMFREGADWRDVAIRLHEDPFAIRQLWERRDRSQSELE